MPPKSNIYTVINSLRMQILTILVASVIGGLWMNYKFLTSIELRLSIIEKSIEKNENKVDKIIDKYIEEKREKLPNF